MLWKGKGHSEESRINIEWGWVGRDFSIGRCWGGGAHGSEDLKEVKGKVIRGMWRQNIQGQESHQYKPLACL